MIKKPFASAIQYSHHETQSPKVVARGDGHIAQQIKASARRHNIPILQDFGLSQKLSAVPIGESVPDSVFFAISNLLDYILAVERTQAAHQAFEDNSISKNLEKEP